MSEAQQSRCVVGEPIESVLSLDSKCRVVRMYEICTSGCRCVDAPLERPSLALRTTRESPVSLLFQVGVTTAHWGPKHCCK